MTIAARGALVALMALVAAAWLTCTGCSFKFIREPKEPKVLHERIAYYKWLQSSGAFQRDPALAREGARALLGLEPEGRAASRPSSMSAALDDVLNSFLRQLAMELLDRLLREAPSAAPPGGDRND